MRILIFIFLTFSCGFAAAQEESDTDDADEITEETEQNKEKNKKEAEFKSPDSFEASERLSEDVPAPFPVDI